MATTNSPFSNKSLCGLVKLYVPLSQAGYGWEGKLEVAIADCSGRVLLSTSTSRIATCDRHTFSTIRSSAAQVPKLLGCLHSSCAANWAELREVYPTKWRICLLLHHVMKKSTFHSSIFPLAKVNDFNHWKYPFQLKTISEFNAMQNALEIFWAFRNLLNSSWCSHQWVASTTLRPDR